jgi:Alcohol dehydrogenase GroES-associated
LKAQVYNGPRDVTVTEVEDARIEWATHVLVRILQLHGEIEAEAPRRRLGQRKGAKW